MDERKKILLGNTDILSRSLKDFYIDVNLSVDRKEIIPFKYDNIFDLTKFYDKERNESRNFVIYGTIDSYCWDCDNIKLTVYQSASLSEQDYLCTSYSSPVVGYSMPFKNIYNKSKGKYIINNIPITFTGYSVWIKMETQKPLDYAEYVDTQQLIFTTLTISNTGEKVIEQLKYGLNEAITDCDGNVIEVNNDFDFFYNKHWIKKSLNFLNLKTYWIGNPDDITCLQDRHGNDGTFHYNTLIELYQASGYKTGSVKPNSGEDAVVDAYSTISCPLPIPTSRLTFTYSPASTPETVITLNPIGHNIGKSYWMYFTNDTVNISVASYLCYKFIKFEYNNQIIPLNPDGKSIDVLMDKSKDISVIFEKTKVKLDIEFSIMYEGVDIGAFPYGASPLPAMIINGVPESASDIINNIDCGDKITITDVKRVINSPDAKFTLEYVKINGKDYAYLYNNYVIESNSTLEIRYRGIKTPGGH